MLTSTLSLAELHDDQHEDGVDLCQHPDRPALQVADIFRRFGPEYRSEFGDALTVQQDRALREILVCRTEALGLRRWQCDACGVHTELFNSCNNRHCPTCQGQYRREWAEKLHTDLLPIEYHHVIFTVPHPVTQLAMLNPTVLYPLVLRAGAEAVLRLGRTWEGLQAEMAVLALLHTWGQIVNDHVHSHCLVPAGGLSFDGKRWVSLAEGTFLPLEELRRLFRDLFLKGLQKAYQRGALVFPGPGQSIASAGAFAKWLAPLREIDWVVRMHGVWDRRRLADPETAVRTVNYLARYVNRVAISNDRLIRIDGEDVLFRYKDYRDGDQWKTKSMPGVEFIRRFLQHILPRGLHHIRRFGFMGPRVRSEKLQQIRELLGVDKKQEEMLPSEENAENEEPERQDSDLPNARRCRHCGEGELLLVSQTLRPTVAEIMRMPPTMEPLAESAQVQLYLPLSAFW